MPTPRQLSREYPVVLYHDPDGGFVVRCLAFEGCVSQGETREEALANIREAIELCLEDAEPQPIMEDVELLSVAC